MIFEMNHVGGIILLLAVAALIFVVFVR